MTSIEPIIASFLKSVKNNEIELYNEFSLQHELGIFLRKEFLQKNLDYKVQFERNVSYFGISRTAKVVKKEIDIVIFDSDQKEKYAIELKFPRNGQVPEQMYSFVKDIRFMEQLKNLYGFRHTYCLVLVDSDLFHADSTKKDSIKKASGEDNIYRYFRDTHIVTGCIPKPTGTSSESITLDGKYSFVWKDAGKGEDGKERKFYCIEI